MKKVLTVLVVAGALSSAVPAALAGPGKANPPSNGQQSYPSVLPTCDAGHGAFEWFADPSLHFQAGQPPYFGDGVLGSARGGATGANNASYSASCNG